MTGLAGADSMAALLAVMSSTFRESGHSRGRLGHIKGHDFMPGTYTQIATFEAVCADPYRIAREVAEQGRRVAGYMCTYTPEELFHAAGYFPVRILGRNSGGTNQADGHLPAYACGFLRSALDMALAGELDFLKLIVFSHTCDTMQNLADIWRQCVPGVAEVAITTPVVVGTGHAVVYFREEIARARRTLEQEAGRIPDGRILESIRLYDEHRALMQDLYALKRARPACLTGRQMMAAVLASFLMPREAHLPLIQGLLAELEAAPAEAGDDRPKVLVVGNMCQNLDYVTAIEDAGCLVLDEDLCSGSRAFAMEAQDMGGPLDRLARMYLVNTACPTKHQPGYNVGGALLKKAQAWHVNGVILLLTKFCEPWGFDYPCLKKMFEGAGIATLLVEVESHQPPGEQFRSRIAAFVEMLEAAP